MFRTADATAGVLAKEKDDEGEDQRKADSQGDRDDGHGRGQLG